MALTFQDIQNTTVSIMSLTQWFISYNKKCFSHIQSKQLPRYDFSQRCIAVNTVILPLCVCEDKDPNVKLKPDTLQHFSHFLQVNKPLLIRNFVFQLDAQFLY